MLKSETALAALYFSTGEVLVRSPPNSFKFFSPLCGLVSHEPGSPKRKRDVVVPERTLLLFYHIHIPIRIQNVIALVWLSRVFLDQKLWITPCLLRLPPLLSVCRSDWPSSCKEEHRKILAQAWSSLPVEHCSSLASRQIICLCNNALHGC